LIDQEIQEKEKRMSEKIIEKESRNSALIRRFVDEFSARNADALRPYFTEDVVFENYGDAPVRGVESVIQLWSGVFRAFSYVQFETLNQAVQGDVVIAEQVHGLRLSGGPMAPIRNMAVYEIRDGRISAWRDYTNPIHAQALLTK
jgi:limonene-1,2-epoxide hydrolase